MLSNGHSLIAFDCRLCIVMLQSDPCSGDDQRFVASQSLLQGPLGRCGIACFSYGVYLCGWPMKDISTDSL